MRSKILVALLTLVSAVALVACDAPPSTDQPTNAAQAKAQAEQKAQAHAPYVPKNDVEFNNYNKRQQIADDPTTLLWCTSSFNTPASPLFTVPIVGKLTSGTKRPYATTVAKAFGFPNGGEASYTPELPGPDGMFGPSDEYRYGFTPDGSYADFTGLSMYCTTEPTVWQRQQTQISLTVDQNLLAAQQKAQAALKAGDRTAAASALEAAIAPQAGPAK